MCAALAEERTPYWRGAKRALDAFRARAITRPGSDAVAAAIPDIVQWQQPLPLRWPVGEDCVAMLRDRSRATDEEWEQRMRAGGLGFSREDLVEP